MWVWCRAWKSVSIPFPLEKCLLQVTSWLLCSWNVFLKKSPALDKLLHLWGKGDLSSSAFYSECDTWTWQVPVPWPQVMACWDSNHHLCFWALSSLQKFSAPFLFQDREFSDFKVLLMQDFITSYFSVLSAEVRFFFFFYIFRMILSCHFYKGSATVKLRIQCH